MDKSWMYKFVARILSLDFVPANRQQIENDMQAENFNWPGFVKLASDKLMLPAVYLSLTKHNLDSFLPQDLRSYLLEILILNRIRNQNVINQAVYVRDLLLKNQIECLFMKGTGNILDGIYGDVGERMVYDIDILVEKDQMLDAANILHSEGFITQKKFNPRALDSTLHYPILLHEDFVVGVEIHRAVSQYLYSHRFDSETILKNKIPSTKEAGFWVMAHKDRIIHNFLHAQLMHSGHYHADISHRDLYDLLLLGRKENLHQIFDDYGHFKKQSMSYLKLMYTIFDLDMPLPLTEQQVGKNLIWRQQKVLQMTQSQLRRYHLAILFLQKYFILPARVLWNVKARNYVFSRLSDRKWYKYHFQAMKRWLRIK